MANLVKLKPSQGKVVEVEPNVAQVSTLLQGIIRETGIGSVIDLPHVTYTTLGKVLEYCEHYKDSLPQPLNIPLPSDDLVQCGFSEWDAAFVNIGQEAMVELFMAAYYLGVKGLLDVVWAKCVMPATFFKVGDPVECRDSGKHWMKGTVRNVDPLKISLDGYTCPHQWDEVRPRANQHTDDLPYLAATIEPDGRCSPVAEPDPQAADLTAVLERNKAGVEELRSALFRSPLLPQQVPAEVATVASVDSGTEAKIVKIHSAVRWNKQEAEIMQVISMVGCTTGEAVALADPKNGNQCLHISAQNGHMGLTKFLLEQKAEINAKNGKGQSPLHMSIEYDFHFQSKLLLAAKADPAAKNADGHEAMLGIDGTKTGAEAWDHPIIILKAAENDKEQLETAFKALEQADLSGANKGDLAMAGMKKKKECGANWDAARFMAVMNKL